MFYDSEKNVSFDIKFYAQNHLCFLKRNHIKQLYVLILYEI